MYQIDHIRAYWLNRAMSIPGGASSEQRGEYWRYIAHLHTAERLSK
jgi:hypothetical protein